MTEFVVFKELLIVLAATIAILFLFQKLRLPTIVGFLLAGVIMGPDGLGLIRNAEQVETLAEIGVVLLLFTIGLESSLAELLAANRTVIWAGVLQVLLTTFVVFMVSTMFGYGVEVGIFHGFLVSLSSTAIVFKILSDRRETMALHGRLATSILLFQDLCLVPMVLLLPVLARSGSVSLIPIGWALIQALLAVLMIFVVARALLPWLFRQVAVLRNREIFLLFVIFVCLGTAWLTSRSGLSLALGAFIAGLVISESEFSHQIFADILPLRDCFSGIFFVSIGMLLKFDFLLRDIFTPLWSLGLMMGIKAAVVFLIFLSLYRSVRLGVILSLSLAQIGEFSFILARLGEGYGLLTQEGEQIFLAASILSMIATPFLIQAAHGLAFGLEAMVSEGKEMSASEVGGRGENSMAGHVVIVGYGLNGQNLSRVLKEVGVPYRILDMDPDLVRRAKAAGEPITFGDGTRPEILQQMGIEKARVLVIAISDAVGSARLVSQAHRLRPDLYTIVRTRYLAEIDHLYQLGANQVIPEEFETSVEIFARVLQEYHIPRNVISLQVDLVRKEHYGTLRGLHLRGKRLDELSQFLAGTTTDILLILEGSPAAGKSLEELQLRSRSGVTVIAAVRNGASVHNPGPEFRLEAGDVLVLLGSHKDLDQAAQILSPESMPGEPRD